MRHYIGGLVFGTGWAVTGACPGTVSAMVGAGSLLGLVTLAGVLCGIALRDAVTERVGTDARAADVAPGTLIADSAPTRISG